jgi:hypothetical protein
MCSILGPVLIAACAVVSAFVLGGVAMADSCPNAALRFGPSANLPDCRAYELVTPRIKGDNSSLREIHGFADGEHVMFATYVPLPGAQSGQFGMGLSSRTPEGWVTTSLTTPSGPGEPFGLNGGRSATLGDGLRLLAMVTFTRGFSAAFINSPLQYGELDQNQHWNTFRVDIPSGAASIESLPDSGPMTEELIDPPSRPPGGQYLAPGAFILGNSADGSRVFFETTVPLPTAPGDPPATHILGDEIYERHGGHTHLVSILPSGSAPECGAEVVRGLGNGFETAGYGFVSEDGSDVVFSAAPTCSGAVKGYMRVDNGMPDARTIELPGLFLARTADHEKLLLEGEGAIYEYDVSSGQDTIVSEYSSNLEFKSGLLGFSADGSRVYSSPGPYSAGGHLSLSDNGVIKQLPIPATGLLGEFLPAGEASNRATVSSDGSRLVFVDRENLTSYDSNGHHEVYVYDATTNKITCVSCNPDGASPQQDSGLLAGESLGYGGTEEEQAERIRSQDDLVERNYPAISTDDKHVFFDSREALVPQDTNGIEDVYEWEQLGTGTCGVSNTSYSSVSGGCVYLISSGAGSNGSWIVGASEDGRNVLFMSNDSLVPQVDENAQQIYDARVDGGFPYTPPSYGCDSGQCQGPQTPAPPLLAPPPSATFVGVGNPTPETASVKAKSKSKRRTKHRKRKHKKRPRGAKRTRKGRR